MVLSQERRGYVVLEELWCVVFSISGDTDLFNTRYS